MREQHQPHAMRLSDVISLRYFVAALAITGGVTYGISAWTGRRFWVVWLTVAVAVFVNGLIAMWVDD
jgi:hypothetical protein